MFDAMLRGGDMDIVSGARTKRVPRTILDNPAAQKIKWKNLEENFLQDSSFSTRER
jgi:hypothetical protein